MKEKQLNKVLIMNWQKKRAIFIDLKGEIIELIIIKTYINIIIYIKLFINKLIDHNFNKLYNKNLILKLLLFSI